MVNGWSGNFRTSGVCGVGHDSRKLNLGTYRRIVDNFAVSKIHFEILPPVRNPEEPVSICGNLADLGGWDAERALTLQWRAPFHVGWIDVPEGALVEYKILRGSWETEAVSADGGIPPNDSFTVGIDQSRFHVVADWKDRFAGRLLHESVPSQILGAPREIAVWLPPSYSRTKSASYPLAVFSDGVNVFDPRASYLGIDLAADEWFVKLAGEGLLPETVVVAVCHPEGFTGDGTPLRDFDLSPRLGGAAYIRFLADELIPFLENRFRLTPQADSRTLVGASLGALNAFHLALQFPGVFGRFACLSTSFEDYIEALPGDSPSLNDLAAHPNLPADARMYFDYGSVGLDECYEPYHHRLASLLRAKGWTDEREFTVRRIEGGAHSEVSWRFRLGDALRFLATPPI